MEESKWLLTLKDSCAVIVPMLSLNTLSKLALLVADNFASNIILHALFAGKPVLLARNGVDPSDNGRRYRTSTDAARSWPRQSKSVFRSSADMDAQSRMSASFEC